MTSTEIQDFIEYLGILYDEGKEALVDAPVESFRYTQGRVKMVKHIMDALRRQPLPGQEQHNG